jgi:serine O-acetyltransferase
MTFKEFKQLVYGDLTRYYGRTSKLLLIREFMWGIGFKSTFWMRLCHYLKGRSVIFMPAFMISRLMFRRYMFKFGLHISYTANIGPGFYIGHFGNIVVSGKAVIGANCNISQGVTIGVVQAGPKKGAPTIGNQVYIGPGAKVIGRITIGDHAAIGANAVVVDDVPAGCTVAGIPAKKISDHGSEELVHRLCC